MWGKDHSSSSCLNLNADWPLTSCVTMGLGLFSIYKLRVKILAPIKLIRKLQDISCHRLNTWKASNKGWSSSPSTSSPSPPPSPLSSQYHHHIIITIIIITTSSNSITTSTIFFFQGQVLGSRSEPSEEPLLQRALELCSVIRWKHLSLTSCYSPCVSAPYVETHYPHCDSF